MDIKTETKRNFIAKFGEDLNLNTTVIQSLIDHFKYKKYSKNSILLKEGDKHPYAYYIVSGSAKMSFYKNDKERIIHMGENGYILVDLDSHFNGANSTYEIAALEDLEVVLFSMIELEDLAYHHHGIAKFLYAVHKKGSTTLQHRTVSLLTENSQDKYERFEQTHPYCFKNLNDNVVAKFLNITPQFMSKMKKQVNS